MIGRLRFWWQRKVFYALTSLTLVAAESLFGQRRTPKELLTFLSGRESFAFCYPVPVGIGDRIRFTLDETRDRDGGIYLKVTNYENETYWDCLLSADAAEAFGQSLVDRAQMMMFEGVGDE